MRSEARAALRELGLIALAAAIYIGVRAITEGRSERAVTNGRRILRLERSLHLDWEQALQASILGHPMLLRVANDVYIWGFWPVLAAAGVYLYVGHRDHYVVLRDAVFLSGLIGFAFFAFLPVAPPRLVIPTSSTRFRPTRPITGLWRSPTLRMSLPLCPASTSGGACSSASWSPQRAGGGSRTSSPSSCPPPWL
jgi:hypothetical protein